MSDSKFKIGDLVRGEDDYCTSVGIVRSISVLNVVYTIEVLTTERTEHGQRLPALNQRGASWLEDELTLIGSPYSKMLHKHGHKKSWNTVLPKPSLEPKVGSFVKIIGNTNEEMPHYALIGSYATIIELSDWPDKNLWDLEAYVPGRDWCRQTIHKNDFKVLI